MKKSFYINQLIMIIVIFGYPGSSCLCLSISTQASAKTAGGKRCCWRKCAAGIYTYYANNKAYPQLWIQLLLLFVLQEIFVLILF